MAMHWFMLTLALAVVGFIAALLGLHFVGALLWFIGALTLLLGLVTTMWTGSLTKVPGDP